MLDELPGWVIDDAESIRREVAEWAGTTPTERWRLARICSRDAIWAIHASGRAETILAHVDPLPASTIEALARLRLDAGWGQEA